MSEKTVRIVSRRRCFYFGGLLFIVGLAIGCLIGFFVLRHIAFALRPPLDKIAVKATDRIRKDFGLDPDTSQKVEAELTTLFDGIRSSFIEHRGQLEILTNEHVDKIEQLLPDAESRERWRKNHRKYLPGPPPPPPRSAKSGN